MEDILRAGYEELGVPCPEEALALLRRYYDILSEKNKVMNLTAIEGEEPTARLHFLDCGALLKYLPMKGKRVADIGSGAGFPGIVLRILEPGMELTMCDSLQKRVVFQQETVDALGLTHVECRAGRAEEQKDMRARYDIVTSRAVARLNILCELCLPMVKKGGWFAAMKGPEPEEELQEAEKCIALLGGGEVRVVKYTVPGTDAVHSLVMVKKLAATPEKYPRRFAMIKKSPL